MGSRGRRSLVAIASGLVLLAAGACAGPAAAVGKPIGYGPRLGACYDLALSARSMWADGTPTVPCTETHRAETYHVGTVDAPPGAPEVQPRTTEMFELFATCAAEATRFLGGEWHTGRVALHVTLPLPADWAAGMRAFSCEAAEFLDPGDETEARRTSSLRSALATPGPLSMGCFEQLDPAEWTPMVPVACDQPHDSEYSGAFDGFIPATSDEDAIADVGYSGCTGVAFAYIGSLRSLREVMVGYLGWDPDYWDAGRVTVRCFVVAEEGTRLTASVKGIDAGPLPVVPR